MVLAGGGVVALTYALDAGALTPRIVAAIEAATGRAATLGHVSIGLGLTPRVTIEDATLANIPGGSRPEMARIRHIEAHLALLPLLGGDIAFSRIAVEGADILLETAADGTPNWVSSPTPRDAAPRRCARAGRGARRRAPAPAYRDRRGEPDGQPRHAARPAPRHRRDRSRAAAGPRQRQRRRPSRPGSASMAPPSR